MEDNFENELIKGFYPRYTDVKKGIAMSLSELMLQQFPEAQWLVDHLIPLQGVIALSGLPGNYKSWITQTLALSISSGSLLFDKFPVTQGKVLIIDKENHFSLIQKRFKQLGVSENLDVYLLDKEFFIENGDTVQEVVDFIEENKIALVILDSLIRIYSNKDENSSNDMAEVFRVLRRFQEAGATVIFTHHHRKQSILNKNVSSESMRGSSDILAAVDSHLAVDAVDGEIKITQTKLRQDLPIKPFKIKLVSENDLVCFEYLGEFEEDKEKLEQAKIDILAVLDEGEKHRTEIIERFKGIYGSKTIDLALKSYTPEEVLLRVGERGKRFYRKPGAHIEGELFNPA